MDHKDWGSDDFLDEFLDFHYDKPVHRPDRDHQDVKPDQKLQTEKIQETRKDNKIGRREGFLMLIMFAIYYTYVIVGGLI